MENKELIEFKFETDEKVISLVEEVTSKADEVCEKLFEEGMKKHEDKWKTFLRLRDEELRKHHPDCDDILDIIKDLRND